MLFATGGSTCNVGVISNSPCCYANYDKLGSIAVADIFAFLNDWFAGSPFSNTGGNGDPAKLPRVPTSSTSSPTGSTAAAAVSSV